MGEKNLAGGVDAIEQLLIERIELGRGRTYVDLWRRTGEEPNTHVGVDVDAAAFFELLLDRLPTLG